MVFHRLAILPLALVGLALAPGWARSASADASWLPSNTVGCFVVSDLNALQTASKETAVGKFLQAEALQPFFQAVWIAQEKDPLTIPNLLGCAPEQLRKATKGSLVLALLGGEDRPPAILLLLDTQDRQEEGRNLVAKLGGLLENLGCQKTQSPGPDKAMVYDLPERYVMGAVRQLVCASLGDYVIVSTRLDVLQDIAARRSTPGANLTENPAYQATTARALKETPGALASWFYDPLGYMSASRTLRGTKVVGRDWLRILKKEGFTALKGFGGASRINAKTGEVLVRGFVHVPGDHKRSMGMLTFAREQLGDAPAWVPHDVSMYAAVANNVSAAFEAFGFLFDTLYGDGEDGTFNEVVKDLKEDKVGPRVDLRKELLARFRRPVVFLDAHRLGKSGERWLLAAPVEEETGVADAVDRLFKGDKSAHRLPFGDHGVWQVLPEALPREGPKKEDGPGDGKNKSEWSLPASAVAVHKNLFLIAGSPDLVRQVFGAEKSLVQDADYQRTSSILNQRKDEPVSLRIFFRLGPLEQQALGALRTGDPRPQNLIAGMLLRQTLSGPDWPGRGVDFKKLPSPDEVAAAMGGQGAASANLTGDTWSFTLILTR
jgi:hypothetical protein